MLRKRWFYVVLVTGLLVIGGTVGTVLAFHNEGRGHVSGQLHGYAEEEGFVSRVATILGLEESQVQEAFQQAARETQDEAIQRKLDWAVENGHLAREEADELKEWLDSRPEVIGPGFSWGNKHHSFHRGFRGHGMGWHPASKLKPAMPAEDS